MEFYSLKPNFLPSKRIEPFVSAIWTERYSSAGDFQLVVQAPSALADELSRGRFLTVRGSKEVMMVENRTIEKGLLTVTGSSLIKFFNEREAWFKNPDYDPTKEFYPRPDPSIVDIYDYAGLAPITFTIPEMDSETYDGRTVILALMFMQGSGGSFPSMAHSSAVTDVVVGAAAGASSDTSYGAEAWRLKAAADRTVTFKDFSNRTGKTGHVRIYVLRGLKPSAPLPNANVSNTFTSGFGSFPVAPAENAGTWTDKRRWLAWMGYRRTARAGHTVPDAAPISDITGTYRWTDDGEIDTFTPDAGVSIRQRTAHILEPPSNGHRPGAVFTPSMEWDDTLHDQGFIQVFALMPDDKQPIPPELSTTAMYADYTDDALSAGEFLAYVVGKLLISPVAFTTPFDRINLDWADDKIDGLSIWGIDLLGGPKKLTFPLGPIYDGIESIATENHLGVKLYLQSASASSAVLRFASYRGVDRTSHQSVTRLIRMSPDMDSLLNSKEFVSSENYKNVVYVNYQNRITQHFFGTETQDFQRRVIRVDAPTNLKVPTAKVTAFRNQVAWNALLHHIQALAVDGQVSTVSGHKFTYDYYLGDLIELVGSDGVMSIAQVTEHIRSHDQSGPKEFPTLSIIDPTLFSFTNDIGTGEVTDREWFGDPTYTQ